MLSGQSLFILKGFQRGVGAPVTVASHAADKRHFTSGLLSPSLPPPPSDRRLSGVWLMSVPCLREAQGRL